MTLMMMMTGVKEKKEEEEAKEEEEKKEEEEVSRLPHIDFVPVTVRSWYPLLPHQHRSRRQCIFGDSRSKNTSTVLEVVPHLGGTSLQILLRLVLRIFQHEQLFFLVSSLSVKNKAKQQRKNASVCLIMRVKGLEIIVNIYGLRRSSLIMGVHPGCPICSIVAASLVAVETDVRETISATKVTLFITIT